ncbi:MAG TPA: hypothetical protein VGZ72_15060 [Stellaceae bacterium]|jgi:hypothetical protein|nr:hypothetical protein [Stellaceae bacterium]
MLHLREIEQGLLVESVRLLQRAAEGEDIRAEAKRFVGGLEVRTSGETDPRGKPVERVYLRRPV